ncbi:hypothetical protein [Corallococcus macrosporus]|uniref:Lipoprotein n=2 Tax=Myxococcaceae TaxID=31 RepID=A0A250JQ83_9BACT|nr:hypothetical protein [Corallococcus macrosporus]AEI62841.1 putative lipoprotein [Corallococcus macrosporus]ATB45276.1 hypothetical protein MYMAC_000861 [Corallococcus macrosporus DSM 14697]
MSIKLTGRLMAAALLSLTAAGCQGEESQPEADALTNQEAPVKQQCVESFAGITSCATGDAKLARTEKGLEVTGLAKATNDGVSSTFAAATQWEQQAVFQDLAKAGQGFALAARDGDQVVSSIEVGIGSEPGRVTFRPQFTGTPGGSNYSVYVYSGGHLQARHINRGLWFPLDASWYDIHIRFTPIHTGFRNHTAFGANDPISSGACVWAFRSATPGAFTFNFDGRQVSGDYVEFVEEVGDGHYPYTSFTGIDMTAAATALTVQGESIVRGK